MSPKPPGTRLPGTTLPRRNQDRTGALDPIAVDENFRAVERQLRRIPQIQSDRPPEVELQVGQEYQTGVLVGTMTVIVRDVGDNFEGYVRFAVVEGEAEFDHSDPTDTGVWNLTDSTLPYATTVDLQAKHGGLIAVAVPYRTFSNPDVVLWVIKQHRFDEDFEAEVTGLAIGFDDAGKVLLSWQGDEDFAVGFVTVGIGSAPSDPTAVSKDGTLTGRTGTAKFDGSGGFTSKIVAIGTRVFLKVVGQNADGIVSTHVFESSRRRGDSDKVQPRAHVVGVRSGNTVTFTLTVDDPSKACAEPEFQSGDLGGSWLTSWDTVTGTAGSAVALVRVEAVTSAAGLAKRWAWRVPWTDELGNTQHIGDEVDLARLEAISKAIKFSYAGFVPADDTMTWKLGSGFLSPGTANVNLGALIGFVFPIGVELTGATARGSRAVALDDGISLTIFQVNQSGSVSSTIATLTHTGTGWNATMTASFSETTDATHSYCGSLSILGKALPTDAKIGEVEFTYNAPSYDKTY